MGVKVSVIMPSLNVGRYIEKCIESVMGQSLKEIEIIAVDAGSEDGTLEILERAAAKDGRIRIINSPVKSYGYQMNLGLKAAQGEYIGIVETDDWAEPEMFKKLYETAASSGAEVVKSSFRMFWEESGKSMVYKMPVDYAKLKTFCPVMDLEDLQVSEFFALKTSIWSAIYSRSFLERNQILFNETPGAAFQDTAFNFKVFSLAKKVRVIRDVFLNYRQDNENSSVNSKEKAWCITDEYREIEAFILKNDSIGEGLKQRLLAVMVRTKFDNYLWNAGRLADEILPDFVRYASREFADAVDKKYALAAYFPPFKWEHFKLWASDPESFRRLIENEKKISPVKRAVRKLGRMLKK